MSITINGKANGNKTVDLIGVRGAARVLGLSPSTISRYLKNHPELDLGGEDTPMVNVATLRAHRAANLSPAPRGRLASKLLATGEAPPPATGENASPSYAVSKAAREAVLADRARLDLDERRALLVPRAEIETAIYDAGAVLQRDLLELGAQLSERLATMDQPREIAALLETELRRILATLASSLRADAAAENEPGPT